MTKKLQRPHLKSGRPKQNLLDRFNAKIDKLGNFGPKGDCWKWLGHVAATGYGIIRVEGKNVFAHRFSYAYFRGIIPAGIFVCHKCDNRECCNPEHLFLGTQKDNVQDMYNKGRNGKNQNVGKTHCKNGHEFTVLNTYKRKDGNGTWRKCKTCRDLSLERYRLKKLQGLEAPPRTTYRKLY